MLGHAYQEAGRCSPLGVSSYAYFELPKRIFINETPTIRVDPVPFRGTERQWTIIRHHIFNQAAQSPLPLRWGRWCSLSLMAGSSPEQGALRLGGYTEGRVRPD